MSPPPRNGLSRADNARRVPADGQLRARQKSEMSGLDPVPRYRLAGWSRKMRVLRREGG